MTYLLKHIFLYGPPGSGKSSVGRALAANLNMPFVDVDIEIERSAGMPIPQIMAERGEPAFREIESAELIRATHGEPAVIALGGGALLREENRVCAEQNGQVVFLDADLKTLVSRLMADENKRPLLAGDLEGRLEKLLEARRGLYASFKLRVANMKQPPEETAWQVQQKLGTFHIRGMGTGYDVRVLPGALGSLGELMQVRGLGGAVAVVTDSNVAPLYGSRVLASLENSGYQAHLITIPAGEDFKTADTVMSMWREFLQAGLDRKSTIVALGGGVVGDLAGFAAATFMRGVAWVCVPTTLLAMVDSSMGGKTGFDLPEGKNLVGSFHPPRLVLADPQVLSTLPEADLRSGLAEVVKHGIISDPELFELCSKGYQQVKENIVDIVRRAMAVKVAVIQEDPYEQGIRAALNLGHTVGHAVESVSRYALRHGEAVAVGMVVEARLAERLALVTSGLSETIAVTLDSLGLPVTIPKELSREEIIKAMRMDKKKELSVVRFALPVKVGEVRVGVAVDDLSLIFEEV